MTDSWGLSDGRTTALSRLFDLQKSASSFLACCGEDCGFGLTYPNIERIVNFNDQVGGSSYASRQFFFGLEFTCVSAGF